MKRSAIFPRDVSVYLTPLEFGVVIALGGLVLQLWLTTLMYRQLRTLVWLHQPRN